MPRDPFLVLDHTLDAKDRDSPGLHALLVAVSRYPYLECGADQVAQTYGLGQLTSPARTVRDLATLLVAKNARLNPPLKTLRVLASPSDLELSGEADRAEGGDVLSLRGVQGATLVNVRTALQEWRRDASYSPDDATLFYFAGYGIQLSRGDSILLLEDFLGGEPLLSRAINFNNIYNGMANPGFPNIAQTQIYVVDACREGVEALKRYDGLEAAPVFDIELGGADNRIAPIFMAAGPGSAAYGIDGGRSFFGDNFIKCLDGGAAECLYEGGKAVWALTVSELQKALSELVAAHNAKPGRKRRTCQFDKFTASLSTKLLTYDSAPLVDCRFAVEPDSAISKTVINVLDKLNNSVHPFPTTRPLPTHPYACTMPAGRYVALAKEIVDEGLSGEKEFAREFIEIKPPSYQFVFQKPGKTL